MNGLPCKKKELTNQPVLSHIGSLLLFFFFLANLLIAKEA
ncbi:hypothetical protein HMPREF9378_0205 [Streptococcus sanguinis SK1 = NCTC 7863]|nr:hypothetical protein HMPREF9378_0205 [Streptococcus sanguinis SK1 = NCTC 7863]